MINHFIPSFWTNLIWNELKKTSIGPYLERADFTDWGDTSYSQRGTQLCAEHGMYYNLFTFIDEVQEGRRPAAEAVKQAVYHIEKDLANYLVMGRHLCDDLDVCELVYPLASECRLHVSFPRIRAYEPESMFCDGVQGLILCALERIETNEAQQL